MTKMLVGKIFILLLLVASVCCNQEAHFQDVRDAVQGAKEKFKAALDKTLTLFKEQQGHHTASSLFAFFKRTASVEAGQISEATEVFEMAMTALEDAGFELSGAELGEIEKLAGCLETLNQTACCEARFKQIYRTIDGTCNNLIKPRQGAAVTPFVRLEPADYDNGINLPKGWDPATPYNGFPLPSPRTVSLEILKTVMITEDTQCSQMLMQWGQFLDHDLTFTPVVTATADFENDEPCDKRCDNEHPCFSIPPARNDTRLKEGECIGLTRSAGSCTVDPNKPYQRQQINELTSYIDASNVYGSSEERNSRLREFEPDIGDMKVGDPGPTGKPYLPPDHKNPECLQDENPGSESVPCYLAGDIRANEQLGLACMHTIWVREHNRIAAQLRAMNPEMDGHAIFEETRKIVGAMMQVITYDHWLPKILGNNAFPPYAGYDDSIDASIENVFATAAYRFGHSLIKPFLARLKDDLTSIPEGDLPLHKAAFSPWRLVKEGGMDPILRGLFGIKSKLISPDKIMTAEITDKLFALAHSIALDLGALNIQRGRDHGLASYNAYRERCGLGRAFSFSDLSGEMSDEIIAKLEDVYGDVDNVEIFVAMLAENPLPGVKVGPTLHCLLRAQFQRLRDGDRFWYENEGVFTPEQVAELKKTTLSRVLCNNGDAITKIQPNAFLSATLEDMVPCDQLPEVDLSAWQRDGVGICRCCD